MKIENVKYNSFWDMVNDVFFPNGKLYNHLQGYVYRGEQSNKFKLIPGALREEKIEELYSVLGKPIDDQYQWMNWQVRAEYTLLREFFKMANHNGLKVPQVDDILRNYNDVFASELTHRSGYFKWISDDIAELAALAQHYGVLTRLIDWSYDFYVALYFACRGAIKDWEENETQQDDTMVIWALNAQYIQFLQPTTSSLPLRFVVPPYHDNPNISAQKGVLSYWEIDVPSDFEQVKELMNGRVSLTDRTPLDELLQQYCDAYPGKNENCVLLYKLEIPINECVMAYEYLRGLGYTAARLFPGYDGIVRNMKEDTACAKVKKLLNP